MQRARSSNLRSNRGVRPQIWRTEEEDMVNALVGAVWLHHMSRRARVRAFLFVLLGKVGLLRT